MPPAAQQHDEDPTPQQLRRAKARAIERLGDHDGFKGAGIGNGAIRVYVRDEQSAAGVPTEIDRVAVEVVIVGEVTT